MKHKERIIEVIKIILPSIPSLIQVAEFILDQEKSFMDILVLAFFIVITVCIIVLLVKPQSMNDTQNSLIIKKGLTHEEMITWGKKFLTNVTTNCIIYGGDLSWFNDFNPELNHLIQESKKITIYIPTSKLDFARSTPCSSDNSMLARLDTLINMGIHIYLYEITDYHLRSTIINCDDNGANADSKIYFAEKVLSTDSSQKDKHYNITILNYCKNNHEIFNLIQSLNHMMKIYSNPYVSPSKKIQQ